MLYILYTKVWTSTNVELQSKIAYAVVLQCSKLRSGVSSTILRFERDRLTLAVPLFYRRVRGLHHQETAFRLQKVSPCLPEKINTFPDALVAKEC